ncbi:MAG: hypothetical protein M0Z77_09075 [Thermoplasmatales archaeon]|jgi:hypothetical protein|nr:hypothetical protein [Thermoplasmatales archaeon]
MSFLVHQNWKKLNKEIWTSLEDLASFRKDVFVELLNYRFSLISQGELDKKENVEALNDSDRAKEVFLSLPTPSDELSCLKILTEYYTLLRQFPTEISRKYSERLAEWVDDHNLRYVVTEDCQFKLTIQGLLLSQVEFLKFHLKDHPTRETLEELESSICSLRNINDAKNTMRIASNLIEGVLVSRAGINGGTLGPALNSLPDLFPHRAMESSVRNIYTFFSDYPNIRHPGTPGSSIRDLRMDDALLSVALIMGFAAFVLDNNSSTNILNGTI